MLTVKRIEAAVYGISSDRLHDGNGLYLRLNKGGSKTFQLRLRMGTATRWITLGQFPKLSLRDARMQAVLKKAELLDPDYTPPASDSLSHMPDLPDASGVQPLFREFAKVWFDRKRLSLSNGKHIDQIWSTLKTYVFPHLGRMHLDEIKQRHVIAVFDPIWRVKHATARHTLGRVSEIFELARLLEHVEVNPADFNTKIAFGHVKKKTKHLPALEWERAPDLWTWLLECDVQEDLRQMVMGLILSAKRTKEIRFLEWADLDLERGIWTSQSEHMKMRRTHRIPVSRQLGGVFSNMELLTQGSDWVFARPRNKSGVMSENAACILVQKFDPGITAHGLRTTFRTWARKQSKYAHDVMEMALSHEKDELVAAYMRDDLLDERRILMQDWADYVTGGAVPPQLIDLV
ncbi:tyrosine-type recombinase/integrase [Thalassorhabdomicrobium marinisediminis]|uniref:tyrosine-type recombinase/integrase n=1 Tax=Thalassorhabdomicrobium marinisediminis TaxID=2170577 RepID=UPI002492526F|nr:integrase arm-type DNA-binding domain-containing protein [Thalassorhabdomicrobium marinisediminis]